MKNILIGGAWPYANGSLHIGHVAALLPGDILARYYRLKGDQVFYVSGSDCHGTPVTIRAKQEGRTPKEISDYYHNEFSYVFDKLGFSYDLYSKTTDCFHVNFVTDFHKKLYQSDYIHEKRAPQAFCEHCQKVLTDRLVKGICSKCGFKTRADQCDDCGTVLEPEAVISPICSECGTKVDFLETTQLYIALSKLEGQLSNYLATKPHWRKNAITFTKRYIDEGLRDRAITRNLDWGIDVPNDIISSEYLTLEGRKISTSQNWAIWVKDIVENYNPDSLRYFFITQLSQDNNESFSFRNMGNALIK